MVHYFAGGNIFKATTKQTSATKEPKINDQMLKLPNELPGRKTGTKMEPTSSLDTSNRYSEVLSSCESENFMYLKSTLARTFCQL